MHTLLHVLAFSALASPTAPTALQCAEPTASKGDVKGGPPLVHVFGLRNATGDRVTITGIETSCGCLRQNLSATVLSAGEIAKLTVEVNTLTQPEGPNQWPIRVRYRRDLPNAPGEFGEVAMVITAKIVRELTLMPPQIAISATGEVVRTLTLSDRREKPLTLIRAESTSPFLSARIEARHGPETKVTLTLAGEAAPGVRDETVVLYSDDPAYPEFRVPVRVQKRALSGAMAVPEEVVLRFAANEPAASALVQVRSPDGKEVAIAKVESDHPALTAKWSSSRGPIATIRVTAAAPTSTSESKGRVDLRVHLAEPAGQVLVLPVSWTSR